MNWKQKGYFIDVSDTKGNWYTAKIQEIDDSSVAVKLLDYDYPPYDFSLDSESLAPFRTHTSGSVGKQRPVQCQSSPEDFLEELKKACENPDFGGNLLSAVQFFRGTLLFSAEDFILSEPIRSENTIKLLLYLLNIVHIWADYVSNIRDNDIYRAIAGAWYEVMSTLKLLLGSDSRSVAFYHSSPLSKTQLIEEFYRTEGFISLIKVSKSKSVPIDFFYSIPIPKVQIGQQVAYNDLMKSQVQAMVERADMIDMEEIKSFNLPLFLENLKLLNSQTNFISRESMCGYITGICSKFILSNIFNKILEGLKCLSNEIDSNEQFSDLIFQELMNIRFIENMLTNDTHYEILRNSASLLGILSKDLENFSFIIQKLIIIGNQTEELNAVKAVTNKMFSSLNHDKISRVYQMMSSRNLKQIDKVTLEIFFIFLERLNPNTYEDSILQFLVELCCIPHYKDQTAEFAVKLLKLPSRANIRVKFFEYLLQSIENPDVFIPISAISAQLTNTQMDISLKNRILHSTLYMIMRGGLQESDANSVLTLAKNCATEENAKEINFQSLWNSLRESFPSLFYNFTASVVQCMTDKEMMKQLGSFLASQDLNWSAFDCFLNIFTKVNEDKCYWQFDLPIKTAPLELEDSLLNIYLRTSTLSIRNRALNLLSFLFTTFNYELPIGRIEEMQMSLVRKLTHPSADIQRVCDLIYELLRPTDDTNNLVQINVKVQSADSPLELTLGMNQSIRHLRLKIAEHLGDCNFMLFHENKPLWAIYDRCLLNQMLPLDFEIAKEPDPYYKSPLKVLQDSKEMKENLINSLNDEFYFKTAWEVLLWLYPITSSSVAGQTFGHFSYKLALIDRSANSTVDFWLIDIFGQHYEKESLCKVKFEELLLKNIAKNEAFQRHCNSTRFFKAFMYACLHFLKYADHLDNYQESRENCEAIFSVIRIQFSTENANEFLNKYLEVLQDLFRQPYSKESKHILIFVVRVFNKFIRQDVHHDFIWNKFAEATENAESYRNYWVYLNCHNQLGEIYSDINAQVQSIVTGSRDFSRVQTNQALVGSLMILLKLARYNNNFPGFLFEILGDKDSYRSIFEMRMTSPRTQKYALKWATNKIEIGQLENILIRYQDDPSIQKNKKQLSRYFNYSNVKETPGKTGIKNLGNSCYMNSIIQQLYNMEGVQELIFASAGHPLVSELKRIFAQLTLSDKKYINIKNLFKVVQGYDGLPLNPLEQMDADEVLGMILNKLEGETDKSALLGLLGGKYLFQIRCENGHISQREEEFYVVPVDVKNMTSLTDSLQGMKTGEIFEGNNKYHCETCEQKVNARKMTYLQSLPKYFIFTLKRFDFNYETMERIKISSFFEFPLGINLKDYTYANEDCVYQLKGFVMHIGLTALGGHYVSYIYKNEKWIILNDKTTCDTEWENIKNSSFGTSNSLSAYILIYERGAVSSEDTIVPSIFRQEIQQSNFRAFQKMWMFSKTYAKFVKTLLEKKPSSRFIVSYFFNVELRIVPRCHLTLNAIMKHMTSYLEDQEMADFIIKKILSNFNKYFMKCKVRIVRQVIFSLLSRTRDPHLVVSEVLRHLAHAEIGKILYISDTLKLINWLVSSNPRGYSREISFMIQYAESKAVPLKQKKPILLSFDSEQEYSLHWIYDLLFKSKGFLPLTELNDGSLLTEWVLNLKNTREADALAKIYKDYPELVNSVYFKISTSYDFQRLHLLIFFYLASLPESDLLSSVYSMWTTANEGESGSYYIELMTAVYILALKRPQTLVKFRDESVLKNAVLWCDHYEKLAENKIMHGLDIKKLKTLRDNIDKMNHGIPRLDPDSEVDINLKLKFYCDFKFESVEVKGQIDPNIVLVGNSHFETWTDLSDKRLINH